MQMKQHNLWHSTDVTNTRTFLQRTTRLRMLPTMPRQEVTTVATPEIQNISLWGNTIIAGKSCNDNLLTMYSSSSYSWKHSEEELFIATKLSFQFNLSIILDFGPQYSFFNTSILDCLRKQLKDSEGFICLYFWKSSGVDINYFFR